MKLKKLSDYSNIRRKCSSVNTCASDVCQSRILGYLHIQFPVWCLAWVMNLIFASETLLATKALGCLIRESACWWVYSVGQ